MTLKQDNLSPSQIKQFKCFLSQQLSTQRKKLTGDQMSKLKKSHFNQYIKKIKYYARKDIEKIKEINMNLFYGKQRVKNYQNKEQPTSIVKKQKPFISPQTKQPSYYYYGKAELSSMKQFIFLAEECHRIEQNLNKLTQRRRNSQFIRNVQQKIQTRQNFRQFSSKSLNLHLTLKSAQQIEEKMKNRLRSSKQFSSTGKSSYQSCRKSLGETNFTVRKSSSIGSLRPTIFKQ